MVALLFSAVAVLGVFSVLETQKGFQDFINSVAVELGPTTEYSRGQQFESFEGELKLRHINDNYHRCQNKLGMYADIIVTPGEELGIDRIIDISDNFEEMFDAGMRYVVVRVEDLVHFSANDGENRFILDMKALNYAASQAYLMPIISVQSVAGGNEAEAMIMFYQLLNHTGDPFIATSAPYEMMMPSGGGEPDYAKVVEIAHAVARGVRGYTTVLLGTPIMKVSREGGPPDGMQKYVEQGGLLLAETPSAYGTTDYLFDLIFVKVEQIDADYKNFDSPMLDAGLLPAVSYLLDRSVGLWSDKLLLMQQIPKAKEVVNDANQEPITFATGVDGEEFLSHVYQRGLIWDWEPSPGVMWTEDINTTKERMEYDFSNYASDPLVMSVIVSEGFEDLLKENLTEHEVWDYYSRATKKGTNCNYDIYEYTYDFEDRAMADSCDMLADEDNPPSSEEAKSRLLCQPQSNLDENPACAVKIVHTMQVGLPVRYCGGNSTLGTDTKPFPAPGGVASLRNLSIKLDPINQFASPIYVDGSPSKYLSPWLGNCINNNFEMLKQNEWDIRSELSRLFNPHPGSDKLIRETELEMEIGRIEQEGYSNFSLHAFSSYFLDTIEGEHPELLDEEVVCIGSRFCFDKRNPELASMRAYSQGGYLKNPRNVNLCGGELRSYEHDPQNLVYGSELIVDELEWNGTGAEACYATLTRETVLQGSLTCEPMLPHRNGVSDCSCDTWNYDLWDAQNGITNEILLSNGTSDVSSKPNTDWGLEIIENSMRCRYDSGKVNGCINYITGADTYIISTAYIEDEQPEPGPTGIDGIYDALAGVYITLQKELSHRDMKMIFNEKRGWETNAIMRSYSELPWYKELTGYFIEQPENNRMSSERIVGIQDHTADSSVLGASSKRCGINVDPANGGGMPKGAEMEQVWAAWSGGWARLVYQDTNGIDFYRQAVSELHSHGVKVLLILNHQMYWGNGDFGSEGYSQGFASMASEVISALGGNVDAYEIWNEPEGGESSIALTPNQLANVASAVIPVIETQDPSASIVLGGFLGAPNAVASYLSQMPSSIVSAVDAIGYHPYTHTPESIAGAINTIAAVKPKVWITEFSWIATSFDGDEESKARYISEMYAAIESLGGTVPVAIMYAWSDAMNPGFGLYDAGGTPKLAAEAFFADGCNSSVPFDQLGSSEVGPGFDGDLDLDTVPDWSQPPRYIFEYEDYLSEGANWREYYHYYEMLYYIDEIYRLLDVYAFAGSSSGVEFVETEDGSYLTSGDDEFLATIYTCDDWEKKEYLKEIVEYVREETGNPDFFPNCVAVNAVPDAEGYMPDPLGEFLCEQGYDVGWDCDPEVLQRQCIVEPSSSGVEGNISTITSFNQLQPGLIELVEAIEISQCLPHGILIALLEREITGVLSSVTGDPFQQIYERTDPSRKIWGPGQWSDIGWIAAGYGTVGSDAFVGRGRYPMGTQRCLDALGISYEYEPAHFQDDSPDVLERSYVGYALCASASKLKNDSGTGDKCSDWSLEEVYNAARAYLGACSQYGRPYCEAYVDTICNLYPEENPILCGQASTEDICIEPVGYTCTDGNIRLLHPLDPVGEASSTYVLTQPWGGGT